MLHRIEFCTGGMWIYVEMCERWTDAESRFCDLQATRPELTYRIVSFYPSSSGDAA